MGLYSFGSFSNIIKRNFSLTLAKLNLYVDMSVWLFVGKQYYRLNMVRAAEHIHCNALVGAVAELRKICAVTGGGGGVAGDHDDAGGGEGG